MNPADPAMIAAYAEAILSAFAAIFARIQATSVKTGAKLAQIAADSNDFAERPHGRVQNRALRSEDKSMPDIFESTDSQLVGAAQVFASVATANQSALGLSLPEVAALTAASTAYGNGYNAMITARDAAKSATQTKKANKKILVAQLRTLARKIYANPTVTDTLIAQLGLAVHDKNRAPVTPVPPTDLVAVGFANGVTKLTWKRNGNSESVVFWLEQSADAETWVLFGTTKKTNASLQGQTPGQTKFFRIRATATDKVSAPSNEAVVYPGAGGEELTLVEGGEQAA